MGVKLKSLLGERKLISFLLLPVVCILLAFIQPAFASDTTRFVLGLLFQWLVWLYACMLVISMLLSWLRKIGYTRDDFWKMLLITAGFAAVGVLLIHVFFSFERDIKVYDSTVYWIRLVEDREFLADSITRYFVRLGDSFGTEYNNLAVILLMPISYIAGVSFPGYVMSIFLAYYLPACVLLTALVLRLVHGARGKTPRLVSFAVCLFLCAFGVPMVWPMINGYLDVSGVAVMALLLNLSLDWDIGSFSVKKNLQLAAVSLLLLLMRRWYAYYIVGFYLAFGIIGVVDMLVKKQFALKKLGIAALNYLMIAGVSCLCLYILNPQIFVQLFGSDYATAYSAYKSMSAGQSFVSLMRNIGFLWVFVALGGMVLLLRNAGTRMFSIRLAVAVIVAAGLFLSVQDMNYHHYYLILPTLLIFTGVLGVYATEYATNAGRKTLGVIALGVYALNFCFGYVPGLQGLAAVTKPMTTGMQSYPKVNADYDVIRSLVDDLGEKTEGNLKLVYVVGDGQKLSPEMLKRSQMPELVDATPFIMGNNNVDLRDGFPSHLFLAEYIVLADPFYTEFQTTQQVSFQVYDMLLHDPVIAEYYALESSYDMEVGRVLVFEKTRPSDRTCVDVLRNRLQAYYPDDPFVYEPNYFIALFEVDNATTFSYNFWEKAIAVQKQAEGPLEMRFDGVSGFSSLTFEMSGWAAGLEMTVANQDGVLHTVPVEQGYRVPYAFEIAGSETLTISIADADPQGRTETELLFHAQTIK